MQLSFDRLIKFDLVEESEESLFKDDKRNLLNELFKTSQEIQNINQFIKDSPSSPGSTDKIIRNELVSAIGATLAIEGTKLGNEEIEDTFQKADLNTKLQRKEREAENSRKVYKFIIDLVNSDEVDTVFTESIIRQIHKYFTDRLNYLGNEPGNYRGEYAATFGEPRRTGLCKTKSEVEEAMKFFIEWLKKEDSGLLSSNIIVKAIMSHYYLTEIHPFADGNGRTARALEALVLYVNGINNYCFWSLANFWSRHKNQYVTHLGNIRDTCDPWDFIIWGMKGYFEEIKRIKERVLGKMKQLLLMDYTRYLLEKKKEQSTEKKINKRIVDVMELLIRSGSIRFNKFNSSPAVKALYNSVSQSTKYRDFKKMLNIGLVQMEGEKNDIYIKPNFRILECLRYNV